LLDCHTHMAGRDRLVSRPTGLTELTGKGGDEFTGNVSAVCVL
jgi:hypothetical protein